MKGGEQAFKTSEVVWKSLMGRCTTPGDDEDEDGDRMGMRMGTRMIPHCLFGTPSTAEQCSSWPASERGKRCDGGEEDEGKCLHLRMPITENVTLLCCRHTDARSVTDANAVWYL